MLVARAKIEEAENGSHESVPLKRNWTSPVSFVGDLSSNHEASSDGYAEVKRVTPQLTCLKTWLTKKSGWTIVPIVFGPLEKPKTTVDACVKQLEDAILGGKLRPGGKLPAERKLAQSLGVNRVTVRSALARLETAGLVTVRQGSGYRIEDYRERGGPELILKLVGEAEDRREEAVIARDLLAMRRQLASVVLGSLNEVVHGESMGQLDAAVARLADAVEKQDSMAGIARCEAEVLRAIVGATRSDVFTLFMNALNRAFIDFEKLQKSMYAEPGQTVSAYRELLLWLRSPHRKPVEQIVESMARRDARVMDRFGSISPGI